MITTLSIENYKSIEKISIKPKKFNLLIGRPNVGKSNILEAISLLGLPNLFEEQRKLSEVGIRCDDLKDLYRSLAIPISIRSNFDELILLDNYSLFLNKKASDGVGNNSSTVLNFEFRQDGSTGYDQNLLKEISKDNVIKPYFYDPSHILTKSFQFSPLRLSCPNGRNIFDVFSARENIYDELSALVKEYDYEIFQFDHTKEGYYMHRKVRNRNKLVPYYLLADTLKRYLFHYAAINTNKEQTLLFEEPESHSYPPYVYQLAQNIVASNNQYFITTHSPYLYEVFVKECDPKDLSIFFVDYKNHKTEITEVNSSVLDNLKEYETDVFFNIESQMNG